MSEEQNSQLDPSELDPGEEDRIDNAVVEVPLPPVPIEQSDIDAAMAEAGLSTINIKRFKALEKVGAAMQSQGVIRVGVGEYVYSNQIRNDVIQKCHRKLRGEIGWQEFCAYAHVLNTALAQKDKATSEMVKVAQSESFKDSEPSFPKGAPPKGQRIVAVQINNNVATEKKES